MRLSDARYEKIKKLSIDMLINYGDHRVPLDTFIVCKNMGLRLVKYSNHCLNEKHFKILSDSYPNAYNDFAYGGNTIYYNDKLSSDLIRINIFHEIGHKVLKHIYSCELSETEADFFAAYSVAPVPLIGYYGIDTIEELSEKFDISYRCAYNSMNRYFSRFKYLKVLLDYEFELIKIFSEMNYRYEVFDS